VSSWLSARLSEIEPRDGWIPIRDHFGIEAFGINAYRAAEAGSAVIGEHAEDLNRHEELYVVLEGHATFTVAGDEVDAPAGTLVFVREPSALRGAVAREAGTTVLAVGAPAGEAFRVATWEHAWPYTSKAMTLYRADRFSEGADVLREGIEHHPDHPGLYYNLACFESRAGASAASAIRHLRRAIELHPSFREYAADDEDFDPIRDDPAFRSVIAGEADSARSDA
jgi:hypothetical protein